MHATQVLREQIFAIKLVRARTVGAGALVADPDFQADVLAGDVALPLVLAGKGRVASGESENANERAGIGIVFTLGLAAGGFGWRGGLPDACVLGVEAEGVGESVLAAAWSAARGRERGIRVVVEVVRCGRGLGRRIGGGGWGVDVCFHGVNEVGGSVLCAWSPGGMLGLLRTKVFVDRAVASYC